MSYNINRVVFIYDPKYCLDKIIEKLIWYVENPYIRSTEYDNYTIKINWLDTERNLGLRRDSILFMRYGLGEDRVRTAKILLNELITEIKEEDVL